jgi:F-type H+-transporting ATPase subunit delta
MNDSRIASRYARALYTLALSSGNVSAVKADIDQLSGLLHESPEFKMLLDSPVLKGSHKVKVLSPLLEGKVEPLTLRFLEMLVEHKREGFLASICRMFMKLFKGDQGVIEARVETAHAWDQDLMDALKSRLEKSTGRTIDLSGSVDPELIGGYRLTLEDQQLDASVVNQLKKIKNELRESKK